MLTLPSKRFRRLMPLALLMALPATIHAAVPNIRLTSDGNASQRPRIALDPAGNAVVVWEDTRFGNDEILWQKFDPYGNALTAVVRLTTTAANSARPDVSCDPSGNSHVVWQEGENVNGVGTVMLAVLDPAGARLRADLTIKSLSGRPRVAARSDGGTDVVYFADTPVDFDIYLFRASSSGATLCHPALQFGTVNVDDKDPVVVTSSSGNASVLWRDLTSPFSTTRFLSNSVNSSCAAGAAGTAYNNATALHPTIAIGGPFVFRMFDRAGDIYNLISSTTVHKISQGSGTSTFPSVGADANDGFVVWRDTRDGNSEIYFCRFWSSENRTGDIRLTENVAASETPDIAVDPSGTGNWIAVWRDSRDGNDEIYLTSRVLMDATLPADPTDADASLTCPPAAVVEWQDASTNETRFEIEVEVNGSGSWVPAGSAPANATSWSGPPLAYGSTYRYRVRACNGLGCSGWATGPVLDVAETLTPLQGFVRAAVIERPVETAAQSREIPNVVVEVMRGQSTLFESVSLPDGSYTLPAGLRCDDRIVTRLESPRVQIVDGNAYPGADCQREVFAAPEHERLVGDASNVNVVWPVVPGATSGDGPNALYLTEKFAAEYWMARGIASPGSTLFIKVHDAAACGSAGGATGRAVNGNACMDLCEGSAQLRDVVYHEFGHRMVIQAAGELLGRGEKVGRCSRYEEASSLDEGLADYFKAAYTGDPVIRWMQNGQPVAKRTLDPPARLTAPTCAGALCDRYYGGRIIGGALWEMREALLAVLVDEAAIDTAVYGAVQAMNGVDPQDRTFQRLLDKILDEPVGQTHAQVIRSAFANWNIGDDPETSCPLTTQVTQVVRSVVNDALHSEIRWESVPGTLFYRLFKRQFDGTNGLGPGILVADSLTDTTAVHVDPDTNSVIAFMVSVVDSLGREGPVSEENPVVTAVDPAPSGHGASLRIWPNPSRGIVSFGVRREAAGAYTVDILDIRGRRVRRLSGVAEAAGAETILRWDGRDARGNLAPVGTYLVRAVQGGRVESRRLVLLR